jgi:hypothetical protein
VYLPSFYIPLRQKPIGAEKTGKGRGEEIDFSTAERIEREKGCSRMP